MKNLVLLVILITLIVSSMQGQYRQVSIKEIQQVPYDSLLVLDNTQNSVVANWTKQASSLYRAVAAQRETVEVVGQVIVPAKVVTFTGGGFTMLLRDTANIPDGAWSGLFCRAGSGDTTALKNAGFLGAEVGDIIRMRGYVDEFPTGSSTGISSSTQFVPIASGFAIVDAKPLPPIVPKEVRDFYIGVFQNTKPGEGIKFTTGEPFEGVYVQLTNLDVAGIVNSTNGTFAMVDALGNEISMLDVSKWFTLRVHKDPTSTYTMPVTFSKIDTIRGFITSNSGMENPRGYRIAPVFPGDIVYGQSKPYVSTHRRNPVIVPSSDTAKISVRAYKLTGGLPLKTVLLLKSINNEPFTIDTMKISALDTFKVNIDPLPENSFVKYFIKALDIEDNATIYANSADGTAGLDTSKGFFFYKTLDRQLTIQDIQYTPFTNGRTPYLGATNVYVTGIVTADTSDLKNVAAGAIPWYMQSEIATEGWGGIWINGPDAKMALLKKGDKITVRGTIQESNEVTRIGNIDSVLIHTNDNPLPAAIVQSTSFFGANAGNGDPIAEPLEGMVVRFNDVTITDINPTFADQYEFAISDGSGAMLARFDGKSNYSNVPLDTVVGKTIIKAGDKFDYLDGIIYFSFRRYKFIPRGNSDFGTLTPLGNVETNNPFIPGVFELSQNYPNPFNPATTIEYNLPKAGVVTMKIFNILGQEIRTLVNGYQNIGRYTVRFDASQLPSGVYFCRLQADGMSLVKRMLLIK